MEETTEGTLIEDQWKEGVWNGIAQLTCVWCQWDTLEGIEAARARKAVCPRCHPPEVPPPSPPLIQAYDRWGRPVEPKVEE